jgi:hypothetical protein
MSLPSRAWASGFSASRPPSPALARNGSSREVRLSFRVLPGYASRTVLHRTTARRLAPTARALHLSWGSSSLRRSCSRCPVLPRPSSRRPREARNTTSSPVPPSGFLNPSAVSAATAHVNPSCPGPTLRAVATPGTFAALFHAADAPGIRPSELSLLGEPGHLSMTRASLRVRTRPLTGTKAPVISDRFRRRAPPEPPSHPCGRYGDRGRETRAPHGRHVRPPCPTRELPRTPTSSDQPEPSGIAGTRPHRPLRSLAPSESPFTRPTAPLAEACALELAPPRTAIVRAGALLGFSPSRAFSTTTSGSVDCESRPGRTGRHSEDHAPLR